LDFNYEHRSLPKMVARKEITNQWTV